MALEGPLAHLFMLATLLLAAQVAAYISAAERLDQFERAAVGCTEPGDYTVERTHIAAGFLLEKLNKCGFAVVRGAIPAVSVEPLRDQVLSSSNVVGYDAQSYTESGSVHLIADVTPDVKSTFESLLRPLLAFDSPPTLISEVVANVHSGPSEAKGAFSRYPFLFSKEVMRPFQVRSADAAFPFRVDIYVPTQIIEDEMIMEICAGSHLVADLDVKQDCEAFEKGSPRRKRCELLAVASDFQCLKENAVRILQKQIGDTVFVSFAALRRFGGSKNDPRRVRVDVQSTVHLGKWWGQANIFDALAEQKNTIPSVTASQECTGGVDTCAAEQPTSKGEHGAIYFLNVDVPLAAIYKGNDHVLASLNPGSTLVVLPLSVKQITNITSRHEQTIGRSGQFVFLNSLVGVYTLRVQGVVRNTWHVNFGNETHAVYLTEGAMSHLTDQS